MFGMKEKNSLWLAMFFCTLPYIMMVNLHSLLEDINYALQIDQLMLFFHDNCSHH
jgi:hypothetical protein